MKTPISPTMNYLIHGTRCLILMCALEVLGCAGSAPVALRPRPEVASGKDVFRLILIRPSSKYASAVGLNVQIDGHDAAKLRSGSYVEVTLPVGSYQLTSRPGVVFGHDFPVAKTNVAGKSGDVRCYSFTMFFGPKILSYPVAPGVDTKQIAPHPDRAEWIEVDSNKIEEVTGRLKRID